MQLNVQYCSKCNAMYGVASVCTVQYQTSREQCTVDCSVQVEDEVRGEEHIERELVALTRVAAARDLPREPPESRARHQHTHRRARAAAAAPHIHQCYYSFCMSNCTVLYVVQ